MVVLLGALALGARFGATSQVLFKLSIAAGLVPALWRLLGRSQQTS